MNITTLIPAYKTKYIPELLTSLRYQTRPTQRILISDDYWASFERENVELVTEPITEIRHGGIETKDGRLHLVLPAKN